MESTTADTRFRAWLREQVKGQQKALGDALEASGVVKSGQVWVSKYTTGGPATASLDHVLVIAAFFERNLAELLSEAGIRPASIGEGGPTLSKGGSTLATSATGDPPNDAAAAKRAHLREIAVLKTRIAHLEIALTKVRDGARDLAKLATVSKQGSPARGRRA